MLFWFRDYRLSTKKNFECLVLVFPPKFSLKIAIGSFFSLLPLFNNDIIQSELFTIKLLSFSFVIHSTGSFCYYRVYCLLKYLVLVFSCSLQLSFSYSYKKYIKYPKTKGF